MQKNFSESETKINLMRAFAGESQARNRYTFAASLAKNQNLNFIEKLFTFTANQEKEHAEIFYNHLEELTGEKIDICGSYPIDITNSVSEMLRLAHSNEYDEYNNVYKNFGDIAKEEGFLKISSDFYLIAKIEKVHGDRFLKFAELLENNKLFESDTNSSWFCLNCGHIHNGSNAPEVCPVCNHNKGYFIKLDFTENGWIQ